MEAQEIATTQKADLGKSVAPASSSHCTLAALSVEVLA